MIPTITKPKVAIISDLHLGVHANSLEWHKNAIEWANWFKAECLSNNIVDIIFCGDWHHNRSEISVSTLQVSADILDILSDFNLIMIIGNHDIYYKYRTDVNSLSVFRNRKNVTILDKYQTVDTFNKKISFCPWNTAISEIEQSNIIFGHFEIETFKMNAFKVCEEGIKIKDLLKRSDLIISGHFHTRHEKKFGAGTILYVGNPFQMDFGDTENQKGYYILDITTNKYDFVPNNVSSRYKKVNLSDLVKEDTITPNIINIISNNLVKLKIDMNISQEDMDILLAVLYKLKPESLTVDYDINYNRLLNDTADVEDLSGIDVEQAIQEFVKVLDLDNKEDIIKYTLDLYEKSKFQAN
tara:strand:- start:7882 stop:8946 length:1065 start_codon:yes stop_codon:yes gene_type:complete